MARPLNSAAGFVYDSPPAPRHPRFLRAPFMKLSAILSTIPTALSNAAWSAVLAIALLVASTASLAQVQRLDKIIAIVEQDVVLQSELTARTRSIAARFANSRGSLPPPDLLREQVLEQLIIESIQLQMAAHAGVRVKEAQLNEFFLRLAAERGLSPEQLIAQFNAQGQSLAMVLGDLRRDLTLQQVQQDRVGSRIYISDAEIDTFLNSAEGQFWRQPSLNLRHIQINLANDADPATVAATTKRAGLVAEKLAAGADFAALAVQYSDGPTALDGGGLGWRRAVEFPESLAAALKNARPGTVTAPVRGAGGLHIFKVEAVRGGDQAELVGQSKTRHILIKPSEIRSNAEAREMIDALRTRIVAGESFAELASEYSDDLGSKLKGGELGWVFPGQMVPAFEAAMNATAVGSLSAPVETPFGWHILRVDERREQDMSADILRNQARSVLRSQRYPEELDLWMREIRDDAFVSLRD